MLGEKLHSLIEVSHGERNWPQQFVVTEKCLYEYLDGRFIVVPSVPPGNEVVLSDEYLGQQIRAVKGDGESAVIILKNGTGVIFDFVHDPFGKEVESWPVIQLMAALELNDWREELEEMDRLF